MADIELVIKIPEELYKQICEIATQYEDCSLEWEAIMNGVPLPKGHGRLGDLDELEQRIRNFVEYDAKMTDERTVARQRFIVDGIRQTLTIIEADSEDAECK